MVMTTVTVACSAVMTALTAMVALTKVTSAGSAVKTALTVSRVVTMVTVEGLDRIRVRITAKSTFKIGRLLEPLLTRG